MPAVLFGEHQCTLGEVRAYRMCTMPLAQGAEVGDQVTSQAAGVVEVEVLQRCVGREPGGFDPALAAVGVAGRRPHDGAGASTAGMSRSTSHPLSRTYSHHEIRMIVKRGESPRPEPAS